MSARSSVRPYGTTRLPLDRFSWNLIFELLSSKAVAKIQVSLKSDAYSGYFRRRSFHIWQYLAKFFLEWEMLYRKSKHTFFKKSRRFLDNVEKYGEAREAADNMADARCMLDKATCAQAHAHARASTRTHSPTHILPYISFFFLLTNYCSRHLYSSAVGYTVFSNAQWAVCADSAVPIISHCSRSFIVRFALSRC